MIKKASSSEVFDIYASKMISKRASAIRKVASFAILEDAINAAVKMERAVDTGALTTAIRTAISSEPELESGIKLISRQSANDIKGLLTGFARTAETSEGATKILDAARRAGYSATDTADINSFMTKFSDDFKKMEQEYEVLVSGTHTDAQVTRFVQDNNETIKFYNKIKSTSELHVPPRAPTTPSARPSGSGGSAGGRADDVPGWIQGMSAGASLIGSGLQLGLVGLIGYGAYKGGSFVLDFMRNPASFAKVERHLEPIVAAIGCVEEINVKPGSPAAKEKEGIITNLEVISKLPEASRITDQEEAKKRLDEILLAMTNITGNGPGSSTRFISLIESSPMENIHHYFLDRSKSEALIGGGVGAAVGAGIGTMFGATKYGALIGGAIGAVAGWGVFGVYYDEQLACLGRAIDSIVTISDQLKAAVAEAEESAATDTAGGQQGTRGEGESERTRVSTDSLSLVQRILDAGRTEKLTGFSGFDLAREKKHIDAFVMACGDSKNAAKIVMDKNSNIQLWLEQLKRTSPNSFSAPINEAFAEKKENQGLIKAIYDTVFSTSKKTIKGRLIRPNVNEMANIIRDLLNQEGYQINIVSASEKNNWNKMNKTSKSINNQELIRKAAETRVSYFGDASLGLKDQLTKSYYSGLSGMYNEAPPKRSSDYKDLYGFQEETGDDLVLQSHPKSITLADSMGKGGLVENGLEQKEKSTYVALNTPSGNFQSKYASTIGYLTKLAKAADDQGKKEVSKLIKQTIQKLK